MLWWQWLLIIAAVVVIALAIGSYRVFVMASARHDPDDGSFITTFYPEEKREGYMALIREGQALQDARSSQTVEIQSDDGLKLKGEIYRSNAGDTSGEHRKRVLIFFHGYHGSPYNDFAIYAKYFMGMADGPDMLLVHERTHGLSEGKYITFGIKERYDLKRWCEFAVSEFGDDCEIMLMGLSMGAATVLSASELALPPQVHAIVSDCGYASPEAQLKGSLAALHIPGFLYGVANAWYKALAHCSLGDSSAIEAVKHTVLPLLVIHGGNDTFVPTQMGKDIAAAAPTCKGLVIVPGAGHAGSALVDPETVFAAISKFMAQAMGWQGL